MKIAKLIILFLVINFGSLAIGSWLMNNGPQEIWYLQLNKAPWTPPGWFFGFAWTTIMICFSVYLAQLFTKANTKALQLLFALQVILNISWNYVFFNKQLIGLGLNVIIILTILIWYFFIIYYKSLGKKSILILPYCIWLLVATSLNLYILVYN